MRPKFVYTLSVTRSKLIPFLNLNVISLGLNYQTPFLFRMGGYAYLCLVSTGIIYLQIIKCTIRQLEIDQHGTDEHDHLTKITIGPF